MTQTTPTVLNPNRRRDTPGSAGSNSTNYLGGASAKTKPVLRGGGGVAPGQRQIGSSAQTWQCEGRPQLQPCRQHEADAMLQQRLPKLSETSDSRRRGRNFLLLPVEKRTPDDLASTSGV